MIPLLIGIVPFGLIAGATPDTIGLGAGYAVAASSVVFAGAAQLAMFDQLEAGAAVPVVVATALMINLRMLMYGASLAPLLAGSSTRERVASSYLLTDQAYAITLARFGPDPSESSRADRVRFYLSGGFFLWATWQVSTVIGAIGGGLVPDEVPLEFTIPLVFLGLLVPAVHDRPSVAAAISGGIGAVIFAELGAGNISLLAGATVGILAGSAVAWWAER